MKIVSIRELTKKFKGNIAVDNISLDVEEGEIYGFLGPNGAGKSTTINIMCGLISMNHGSVNIMGIDISKDAYNAKKNIGIVPQDIAIYDDLTAYENIKFFASLYGLRGRLLKERVNEALEFVGLSDKANQYAKTFSGGMRRRLNIACALPHRPKLVIMDEPTVGIDPQSRNHILQSVKKLNSMGSTIIYTSHYMEEVEEIASRVAIMDHGKIIAEGTKDELKSIVMDTSTVLITVDSLDRIDIKEISSIHGVSNAHIEDKIVKINSSKDINNLDKIIHYFTSNDIIIKNIESKTPDLETVFLTLTGRKLRD